MKVLNLVMTLTVLIGISSVTKAGSVDDANFVRYELDSVVRGMNSRVANIKSTLNRELSLYSEADLESAKTDLSGYCVTTLAEFNRDRQVTEKNDRALRLCRAEQDMFDSKIYPEGLALKMIDAIKEIQARNDVLLLKGSMVTDGGFSGRTGVMSKSIFNKIATGGLGDDLVGYGDASYEFEGSKYQIQPDLAEAMIYLDFTSVYDSTSRTWKPKYKSGSMEDTIIKRTDSLIATYEIVDPHFKYGKAVRSQIGKDLSSIVNSSKTEEDAIVQVGNTVSAVLQTTKSK